MEGSPRTSIVIPTRGDSFLLRSTIDALNVTLPTDGSIEVIVVRDGPGLDPPMTEPEDFPFPLRLMSTAEKSGPARARNLGASCAVGDVLVFLDDDVIVPPDWTDGLRTALDQNPDASLISGPIRAKEAGNLVSQMFESFVIRHHTSNGRVYLASACLVVRRPAFDRLEGFAECFPTASGEDWDFSHRAHELGLGVAEFQGLLVYHWNPRRFTELRSRAHRYASSAGIISGRLSSGPGRRVADRGPGADRSTVSPLLTAVHGAIVWIRRYRMAREFHGRVRSAVLLLLHLPWFITYGLAVRHQE